MAMGTGGASGGGRRSNRRTRRRAALSEINVTPMVDVMLVLLIIFMISAPLLTAGVKVDLPKTEAAALKDEGDPLTVSIKSDGSMYIKDTPASYAQLTPRLLAMANNDTTTPVYIRGDGAATWDTVAKVMGKLSSAGFVHLNLVTDTMSNKAGSVSSSSSGAASQ